MRGPALFFLLVACGGPEVESVIPGPVPFEAVSAPLPPQEVHDPLSADTDVNLHLVEIAGSVSESRHDVDAIKAMLVDQRAVEEGKAPRGFVPKFEDYAKMAHPRPLYGEFSDLDPVP